VVPVPPLLGKRQKWSTIFLVLLASQTAPFQCTTWLFMDDMALSHIW